MVSNNIFYQLLIGITLGLVTFSIAFMAVNSSLSCVDKNGCLRTWCDFSWLKYEYQVLIIKMNPICPYQKAYGEFSFTNTQLNDAFLHNK